MRRDTEVKVEIDDGGCREMVWWRDDGRGGDR